MGMNALPEFQRAVSEALVVLLQLSAALVQVRDGNVPSAAQALTGAVQAAPDASRRNRYGDEALYWRARLAGTQTDLQARVAAGKDYIELLKRLPEGRLRREVRLRLAALSEPGGHLSAEEARKASAANLKHIGKALHDYAADHGGRLPGAFEDLLGDHVTDETVLVRPGSKAEGGGRAYVYHSGVRAELNATTTESGAKVALSGGVPVVVWEPLGGSEVRRLILRLDGEVRSVQVSAQGPPRAGPERPAGVPGPRPRGVGRPAGAGGRGRAQ